VKAVDGVHVYDVSSGKLLVAIKKPKVIYSPEFSPDGSRIAVESGSPQQDGTERTLSVFDVRSGQELVAFKVDAAPSTGWEVPRMKFNPDGSRIVRASTTSSAASLKQSCIRRRLSPVAGLSPV